MRQFAALLGLGTLIAVTFWPFFRHGLIPTSTDVLNGFYHPWIHVAGQNQPFPFPVKNVEAFDVVRQVYPWRYLAIADIKQGQFPLWNPTQLSGVPLAAEFISGALSPINLLFLITSFNQAWGLTSILQVAIAFLTMYFFARSYQRSVFASLFMSMTYALSGFMAGFFNLNLMGHAFAWIPLVLLGILNFSKTGRSKWLVCVSLGILLIATASHLQILFYASLLACGFLLAQKLPKKALIVAFIFMGVGLACASVQLIPSVELLMHGQRASNFQGGNEVILSPVQHLLLLVAPDFLGNPGKQNYFGPVSYYHEFSVYIGIPILFFSLVSLATRTDKQTRFWLGVLLVSLLMVIDSPLSRLPATLNIPVLGSITPTRIYAIVNLALVMLGGIGLDWLRKQTFASSRKWIFGAFCVLAVALTIIAINAASKGEIFWRYLYDTTPAHVLTSLRNLVLPTALLFTTVFLAITSLLPYKHLRNISLGLLLALAFWDVHRQFMLQNTFVSPQSIFPQTQITSYLSDFSPPARVLPLADQILPANIGAVYGWENIDGYQANSIYRYLQTVSQIDARYSDSPKHFTKMVSLTSSTSPVINDLGVNFILTPQPVPDADARDYELIMQEGEVYLYRNHQALPRFRLPQEALGDITIDKYSSNAIALTLENGVESQVLSTFIPNYPGWHASVNNVAVPVQEDEYGFITLSVPSGVGKLKLWYLPDSFVWGGLITLVACLGLVGLYVRRKVIRVA